MHHRLLAAVLGACAVACALARPALAEPLPSFDARVWKPSTDPRAQLVLEPTTTPGAGVFSTAAWASYAYRPIALRDAATGSSTLRPVSERLTLDLTANLGIGARTAVGVALPVALLQTGSTGLPSAASTVDRAPRTAIGDLMLTGKRSLVDNRDGGLGLAALATVALPSGSRQSFLGEGSLALAAHLVADYNMKLVGFSASLGFRTRTENRTWPEASAGGVRRGEEIPWAAGVWLKPFFFGKPFADRQQWEVAAHGWVPAGPVAPFGLGREGARQLSPVVVSLSDRLDLGRHRDAFLLAGAQVGASDAVGVPAVAATLAVGWSPRNHDLDGDGVDDVVDQCPEIPEDRDGFEDSDGCPDLDDDDDGVLDDEDRCPRVKGLETTDPNHNGCPVHDRDGDGVPDGRDACPDIAGSESPVATRNGCPADRDGDGIADHADQCASEPEDRDGYKDDDGCPDPDNDGDGVADLVDACPREAGIHFASADIDGCPTHDRDGDTIADSVDRCPSEPETFNGIKDDDGCPDTGGAPLVVIEERGPARRVRLARPIRFAASPDGPAVDKASVPLLRALALELRRHPAWTLGVGARTRATDGEKARADAAARATATLDALKGASHGEAACEIVTWDAVSTDASALDVVAFRVLEGEHGEHGKKLDSVGAPAKEK